ncbi:hypothetical protein BZM27_47340 [Paraburkholderia steynii]|uniref:Uncharacterized protein n=1 Tax=Paraburkholderia steynii TaxID=1245441 RepID=A0A4R0X0P8_9BURK|nr:hypothetical protein BZM27_47340 [Paraburkholderia steynii]
MRNPAFNASCISVSIPLFRRNDTPLETYVEPLRAACASVAERLAPAPRSAGCGRRTRHRTFLSKPGHAARFQRVRSARQLFLEKVHTHANLRGR